MRKLFTSESVTEGHPDKLCDQIADQILYLASDRASTISGQAISVCGDMQMLA